MKNTLRLLVLLLGLVCAAWAEQPIRHIPYLEFLTAVNEGKIKEAHFNNLMVIEGELQTADGIVRFDTTHPMQAGDDPLLLRYLEDRKIKITKSEQSKFQRPSVRMSGTAFMFLIFALTVVITCVVFVQLRILKRIERKANQPPQTTTGSEAAGRV